MSKKVKFFHVIMLDESGSMSSIRDETISGFNETVQQIKADAEYFHLNQFFSAFVRYRRTLTDFV